MCNYCNYIKFNRKKWKILKGDIKESITKKQLLHIKSIGDCISLNDINDIYLPLCNLIKLNLKEHIQKDKLLTSFMNKRFEHNSPFIIGIAGSVAVGKSTIARLLSLLLSKIFPKLNIYQITTDGFLYPNSELRRRGILNRKGFPESYDMKKLISFLNDVKDVKNNILVPKYSHQLYDIIPGDYEIINHPDILIVEGINTLQLPSNQQIYVSDYFDFSIYVDADPEFIEKWFIHRFNILLDSAFKNPSDYYYPYTKIPRSNAIRKARRIWYSIDLLNLYEYILPTKLRATLIIHKTKNHKIDQIYLKKF